MVNQRLSKQFEDEMFKIGEGETKVSVTTWKDVVRVHFRKFFQSKFDRKKFYLLAKVLP